jgi:4-hydroxy-tetrahydrodipicolinate reductase
MGQALGEGLSAREGLHVVGLVDPHEPAQLFSARYYRALEEISDPVDAVVDFSKPESVVTSADWCVAHGVGLVVGTTGLSEDQRARLELAGQSVGVVLAANFSLGAVLAERFAALAAPYFDRVEIIELHHDRKADAPSGTSLATARALREARARVARVTPPEPTERLTLEGARGADAGDGVRIHSVRLPGLVAHQEILFGGPGEGLTIRHDSYDRQSFVQGVALALAHVNDQPGFSFGIDHWVE